MGMFDEKTKKKLTEILSEMKEEVKIIFFTDNKEENATKETGLFLDEIGLMSNKILIEKKEIGKDKITDEQYDVDKVPAMILVDSKGKNTGVRYFGLPGGYEINSFVKGILEVSGKRDKIPDELISRINKIDKKIHIQVFVSMTCPYCPGAVMAAHILALENNNITADMIESSSLKQYAEKYSVNGVPKTVINNTMEFIGARPLTELLKMLEELN